MPAWTCVELLISGRFTGMKAHIQVKATGNLKANSDGSVSYSADVSNINTCSTGSARLRPLHRRDQGTSVRLGPG